MCNNVMYPEGMQNATKPRPDQIPLEKLIKMVGKPVFFVGSDYNDSVRIVEWRVIDYIIIRKSGMVIKFTDSQQEYNVNKFQAFDEEVYPVDKDFVECDDPDYAELITRIRSRFRTPIEK